MWITYKWNNDDEDESIKTVNLPGKDNDQNIAFCTSKIIELYNQGATYIDFCCIRGKNEVNNT